MADVKNATVDLSDIRIFTLVVEQFLSGKLLRKLSINHEVIHEYHQCGAHRIKSVH